MDGHNLVKSEADQQNHSARLRWPATGFVESAEKIGFDLCGFPSGAWMSVRA